MPRLKVTKVIEEDVDRVLLAGTTPEGERRTFHIRKDEAGQVDKLIGLVRDGEEVEVDL